MTFGPMRAGEGTLGRYPREATPSAEEGTLGRPHLVQRRVAKGGHI